MKQRAIHRTKDKINNCSRFGWHKKKLKWCMFTGHDIDFHDKSDAELSANDALFTGTPIIEEKMQQHGDIERDLTQKDIPTALDDIELIDDEFIVEQWGYKTLKNRNFIFKWTNQQRIMKILNDTTKNLQAKLKRLQEHNQVMLCFMCACLCIGFCG